jgi:NitT/TauT family transport system ATP-binding protein
MRARGAPDDLAPGLVGRALAAVIEGTEQRLRFAVVHPHSGHNYELRYWLAASGIDPDRAVEIVVLPPPLMPDAIRTGGIDGYCVGEPWNSVAVTAGVGRIATVKAAIWPKSLEKVLGTTQSWAERNPEALAALIRALYAAAQWCGVPANHAEAASLLARPDYLGIPAEVIGRALSDGIVPDFFVPYDHGATYPRPAHALWLYSQMVRWDDVQNSTQNAELARTAFRPDLYREALGLLELPPEPVGFFDGRSFDPADLNGYIASQRPYA